MTEASALPRTRRRTIMAWALWDWGGSAYSAVVVTFVFAPYLTSAVAADKDAGAAQLGWAMGIAGALVAIIAPAAGTRADAGGHHRRWLAINTGLVVACVLCMFFIRDEPAFLWPGLVLLGAASIFYTLAEVSYNGLLTRLATPANTGRISGLGWGLGYLGGLAMLVFALFAFIRPEVGLFGAVDAGGLRYRIVAAASGAWFLLFALPIVFLAPRDRSAPTAPEAGARIRSRAGLGSWLESFRLVVERIVALWREDRPTLMFFAAAAVYRDGLTTIFSVAGVLAAGSYGFSASQVIYLGVAANLVARLGCLASGWFDDRFGPRAVILTGLVCLIAGGLPIAFGDSQALFWVCAMWLCLFVGPVNASSRSYLARITPPERAGEDFGLYATTGRAVSFLGPTCFALFITLFGFQRAGALGIVLVLAAGLVLMRWVPRAGAR
ncbi:MFS transporter [Brevibacterium sp. BRM-1]|uniref:MFS transporter n=1 Tax=Brevibacterium sp. BRM-1 TaxID=2999062 RepID=UPI0022810B6B|nr:MFS transporter [Brevibacterium sp. BRM-1]WAL39849.1 MFS transporter [Brevibacterium sp. BRM-1]